MKKTITITLVESDLALPNHLKKPPSVDLNVDKAFNDLEAIQIMLSCVVGMFNNYKQKVDSVSEQMKIEKPN